MRQSFRSLGCIELEMADAETVEKVTGAAVGFAGPIGLDIDIVVDLEVAEMKTCGGSK